MTNEQAIELFKEYRRTGDIKLRNQLVENYMYVAENLAKRFSRRGVEYDDLLQVASEALILGVEKFDPDLGNRFTTYITPAITGIICNYFRDYSRLVRPPRYISTLAPKVKKAIDDYFMENGVKPTVKQLSKILGEDEERIIEAMEYRAPISLDTPVKDEENDTPLYEVIADKSSPFERFEDLDALRTEISKLSPKDQKVVKLRYFEGKSQDETGKILGMSQMSVSRAETRIVELLREKLLK